MDTAAAAAVAAVGSSQQQSAAASTPTRPNNTSSHACVHLPLHTHSTRSSPLHHLTDYVTHFPSIAFHQTKNVDGGANFSPRKGGQLSDPSHSQHTQARGDLLLPSSCDVVNKTMANPSISSGNTCMHVRLPLKS